MNRISAALALLLAGASGASAHAMLEHATPGAGARLAKPPANVVLDYSEALEPAFSAITVGDANGHNVARAPSSASGMEMKIALRPLAPGQYRVIWHAVSVDTHRTMGSYGFTVLP